MDRASSLFGRYRDAGDLAALGALFDLLAPRLLSLALHLCRHAADAEDAVQATFVVAMRKAAQFEPGREVAPWLAGILAGEARNLMRRRQRSTGLVAGGGAAGSGAAGGAGHGDEGGDAAAAASDPAASPAEQAERRELVQQLRTHITALPDEQRQVLLLQLEHGLRPIEIAEVLAVPAGTVRVRLHRGLQALRRLLPASLATLLLGQLTPRGLAAMRQAVLREAELLASSGAAAAATAIGITFGGLLAMKKVAIAAAVAVLAAAVWWSVRPAAMPAVGTATAAVPAIANGAAVQAPTADTMADPVPNAVDAAPPMRSEQPQTGGLRVEVRRQDGGEPVTGVLIMVRAHGQAAERNAPLASGITGDAGDATFADLPAGEVAIGLQPDGQGIFGKKPLLATIPAGGVAVVRQQLPIGMQLRGRTVDEVGAPVGGALLLASGGGGAARVNLGGAGASMAGAEGWRVAGRSGDDGTFAVPLVMGEYMLGACSSDHAAAGTQRLRGSADELVVVLERQAGIVGGSVRDAAGAGIAGARLCVRTAEPRDRWLEGGTELSPYAPMQLRSDDGGRFTLPGLGLGEHVLETAADGFAPATQRISIAAPGPQSLAIVLQRQATVAVQVRTQAGEPVADAHVAVWCGDLQSRVPGCELRTDAQGRCLVAALPAGDARVRAIAFGSGRAEATLLLRAGEQHDCELRLQPRAGIRGRLVDGDGAAVAGAAILATDEDWTMSDFRDRQQAPYRGVTGADGSFALPDLGPYPFRLQAQADGGGTVLVAEHVEPGPQLRTFVLPEAAGAAGIAGRVLGPDGRPCAGARVYPRRRGYTGSRGFLTDADGRFELTPLDPGTYEVQVSGAALLPLATAAFELAAGEQRDLGVLRLRRGSQLRVRVLAVDGKALPGADACFWPEDGADRRVVSGNGCDGAMVFGPMPAGRGRVCISDANLVAWPLEVQLAEDQDTTVELRAQVGTLRRLRFERAPLPQLTMYTLRVVDDDSRELRRERIGWPADTAALDRQTALLPGRWHVTLEPDAAAGGFAGDVTVADLTADDAPVAIPPIR